jgi:hypothetical protein
MDEKQLEPRNRIGRKALSARNKIFLDKLADGVSVIDAYRLAGYTGGNHTAYELKRQLKLELKEVLEARGFTMEGVAAELLNLSKLPVDLTKYPNGIPLSQKLQILRLHLLALKDDTPRHAPAQQNVTAFIINRGQGSGPKVSVQPPVDTTATEQGKPQ